MRSAMTHDDDTDDKAKATGDGMMPAEPKKKSSERLQFPVDWRDHTAERSGSMNAIIGVRKPNAATTRAPLRIPPHWKENTAAYGSPPQKDAEGHEDE